MFIYVIFNILDTKILYYIMYLNKNGMFIETTFKLKGYF